MLNRLRALRVTLRVTLRVRRVTYFTRMAYHAVDVAYQVIDQTITRIIGVITGAVYYFIGRTVFLGMAENHGGTNLKFGNTKAT